jgi:hypothetical protein
MYIRAGEFDFGVNVLHLLDIHLLPNGGWKNDVFDLFLAPKLVTCCHFLRDFGSKWICGSK